MPEFCSTTGKIKYKSWNEAQKHGKYMRKNNTWGGGKMGVYKCKYCWYYHLTSNLYKKVLRKA